MVRLVMRLACVVLALAPALAADEASKDWKPIDQAQLALKAPIVEKDADAEVIFWEVQVEFKSNRAVLMNYIRIKIFTDRGKETQSRVDLPYNGGDTIEEIAGRTIKQNGNIIELKNDAIFDRTIVKASGFKLNAKSFVMPAVESGSIIEYRWRELRKDYRFLRMYFQRDIPIQIITYSIKSHSGLRLRRFNMRNAPSSKGKNDSYNTTMTNVLAFREEPYMPPEDQLRSWMLAYSPPPFSIDPESIKKVYEAEQSAMKVDGEVRRAAAAAIGDASRPEQKLQRLYDFCRSKIKNVEDDTSGLSYDDRSGLKQNKSASDTLKRGLGTGDEINVLFGALVTAAGFVARIARVADRSDFFYKPDPNDIVLNLYFMRSSSVGVLLGNEWRFFDPASTYVPFGMLRWQEEGRSAMMLDPFQIFYRETQLSPPEKTLTKRVGKFRLDEAGTLDGDALIEYTGHIAVEKKKESSGLSPGKREQNLLDDIKGRIATAEVSDIRFEDVTDPVKPLVCKFHLTVPGYAQRTGKRLFLQPAFFQKGVPGLFSVSQRKYAIYFHYSWMEDDSVTIELPPGFTLENTDNPAPFAQSAEFKYDARMTISEGKRSVTYRRSFSFGSGGAMLFPPGSYDQLKQRFNALLSRDNQAIVLAASNR